MTPPRGWAVEKQAGFFRFQPRQLQQNQQVTVDIYDAEQSQQTMGEYLRAQMKAHQASDAEIASCTPKQKNNEASCVTKLGGADHYWYAFKTNSGEYRYSTVVLGPTTLSTVGYIFPVGSLLKKAKASTDRAGGAQVAVAKSAEPAAEPSNAPSASSPENDMNDAVAAIGGDASAAAPTGAAGTRTQAAAQPSASYAPLSSFLAIYLHLEYQGGVGGMVYPVYEPYIFLRDGSITDDLKYHPSSDADVSRWRTLQPRKWGKWTKNGSALAITWNDAKRKPETWDKWFVARPWPQGMTLSGLFTSIGGGGNTALGGSTIVAAWNNYRFSPDGTVTNGRGAGGSSPGVAVSSKKADQQARYKVDKYAIDFDYADGRRERKWFFVFPDSTDVIGVGDSVVIRSK